MFQILNDYTVSGFINLFARRTAHKVNYHLRNRDTDLRLPKLKTEFPKGSFKFSGFKFSGAMLQNQVLHEAKLTSQPLH